MRKRLSFMSFAAFLALVTALPAAAAEKHVLAYEIYAGGFQALKGGMTLDLSGDAYRIDLSAETQNFIGNLFPWSGAYSARGHLDNGKALPAQHISKSTWKKSQKTVQMDYGTDGKLLTVTTTENGITTAADDILPELAAGTVDMLSATLMMIRSVEKSEACKGSFPVFDGKRRFNINLQDAGKTRIAKSKYSIFEGEALRCTLKVEPVAGFRKKDLKRGWMAVQNHTEERQKLPTIWFARVSPDQPLVPVRMEIASTYGAVVAHLSAITP